MKDLFSSQSDLYARYRPVYPAALYEFLYQHIEGATAAWDCATGNGQVARELSKHFNDVWATDISQKQLDNAHKAKNIHYSLSPAEKTTFSDDQFDLVTVGQALHWFNVDGFYNEVRRVAKKNALLAAWGYGLCTINEEIDNIFLDFYRNVVGPYWDDARRHVENEYKDIPFPFQEIETPNLSIGADWPHEAFIGYLNTWSATQNYIKEKGHNPVNDFARKLATLWPAGSIHRVTFPLFIKAGQV